MRRGRLLMNWGDVATPLLHLRPRTSCAYRSHFPLFLTVSLFSLFPHLLCHVLIPHHDCSRPFHPQPCLSITIAMSYPNVIHVISSGGDYLQVRKKVPSSTHIQ